MPEGMFTTASQELPGLSREWGNLTVTYLTVRTCVTIGR